MSTSGLPFIDAHHHLWDAEAYHYPGLNNPNSPIPRRYLLEDFLGDGRPFGLVKSVHLQGEIGRESNLEETRWLQGMADQHGFPHGIVAYAPLQDPDVDDLLARHARYANVRGIRQILNPDQCERPDYLTDQAWKAGYARLARYDLSFDLQALPSQMADAAAVAGANPSVQMIVNHTGMPRDQSQAGLAAWRRGMRGLADVPHVSVKISGFGMFDAHWTTESIRPLVLQTIDIFGVDRCLFASNFPVDKVWSTYERLMQAFYDITQDFSESERRMLFHDNAERIYRL